MFKLKPIKNLELPSWEDFPDIDLYMDQLVSLGNRYLIELSTNQITASMVNSYVKKGLITRPVKKKYQRQHIAELLMVSLFKAVYSLESVKQVIQQIFAEESAQSAYNNFAALFNYDLRLINGENIPDVTKVANTEPVINKIEEYTIRASIYQMLGQKEIALQAPPRAKEQKKH